MTDDKWQLENNALMYILRLLYTKPYTTPLFFNCHLSSVIGRISFEILYYQSRFFSCLMLFERFSKKKLNNRLIFKIFLYLCPVYSSLTMMSIEVGGAIGLDPTWRKSVTRCFVDWLPEITTTECKSKTLRSLMPRVCWIRIPVVCLKANHAFIAHLRVYQQYVRGYHSVRQLAGLW